MAAAAREGGGVKTTPAVFYCEVLPFGRSRQTEDHQNEEGKPVRASGWEPRLWQKLLVSCVRLTNGCFCDSPSDGGGSEP